MFLDPLSHDHRYGLCWICLKHIIDSLTSPFLGCRLCLVGFELQEDVKLQDPLLKIYIYFFLFQPIFSLRWEWMFNFDLLCFRIKNNGPAYAWLSRYTGLHVHQIRHLILQVAETPPGILVLVWCRGHSWSFEHAVYLDQTFHRRWGRTWWQLFDCVFNIWSNINKLVWSSNPKICMIFQFLVESVQNHRHLK